MVINSRKTYENLKKKGFYDVPGDHKFLRFFHNGNLILSTKVSHGSNHDLDDFLIGQMASQCGLNKKDFLDLVNCPLSEKKYISIIKEKGVIK
jgi:hypothetical protein